mmetsp:Transcript_24961/g.24424  ORF Transcript_24961/g.24424 Transcript_24961/m.24424 type:complete len:267 (+) Transcript_24961:2-802(+)
MEQSLKGEDFYKGQAELYELEKTTSPQRQCIEVYTVSKIIETLKDEDVMDLACGTGYYSRKIRAATSGKVYASDISEDMIKFAKEKGGEIEYFQHDMAEPMEVGMKFDVVFAVFIYQYCRSKEMLDLFVRNTAGLLKPGGKIYAFNGFVPDHELLKDNVNLDVDSEENKKKVFISTQPNFPPKEFDPFLFKYYVGGQVEEGKRLTLNYFTIFPETLKKSFEDNGFEDVTLAPMELDPNHDEKLHEYFSKLDMNKVTIRWSAVKKAS